MDSVEVRATQLARMVSGGRRDWMTGREVAERLGISKPTLLRYRTLGIGPAYFLRGNGLPAYYCRDVIAYEDDLATRHLAQQEKMRKKLEREKVQSLKRIKDLRRRKAQV